MLQEITSGVAELIKHKKISEFTLTYKDVLDFAAAVIKKDPQAYAEAVGDMAKLLWQVPNAIFWDKMRRFLMGTFSDYEYQVKMCEKFRDEDKRYTEFVKKQIQLIEKLDFDSKVDWFANLTRAFLLESINEKEYFKLSFALRMISEEDLTYLTEFYKMKDAGENNVLNSFYQHGLADKKTKPTSGSIVSQYHISPLGIKFLKYGIDPDHCMSYQA